jgi:hypothetical protein
MERCQFAQKARIRARIALSIESVQAERCGTDVRNRFVVLVRAVAAVVARLLTAYVPLVVPLIYVSVVGKDKGPKFNSNEKGWVDKALGIALIMEISGCALHVIGGWLVPMVDFAFIRLECLFRCGGSMHHILPQWCSRECVTRNTGKRGKHHGFLL